jgi:hypothetical protein
VPRRRRRHSWSWTAKNFTTKTRRHKVEKRVARTVRGDIDSPATPPRRADAGRQAWLVQELPKAVDGGPTGSTLTRVLARLDVERRCPWLDLSVRWNQSKLFFLESSCLRVFVVEFFGGLSTSQVPPVRNHGPFRGGARPHLQTRPYVRKQRRRRSGSPAHPRRDIEQPPRAALDTPVAKPESAEAHGGRRYWKRPHRSRHRDTAMPRHRLLERNPRMPPPSNPQRGGRKIQPLRLVRLPRRRQNQDRTRHTAPSVPL